MQTELSTLLLAVKAAPVDVHVWVTPPGSGHEGNPDPSSSDSPAGSPAEDEAPERIGIWGGWVIEQP